MLGLTQKDDKQYLYVLGSTGDFRMKVSENTPGAEKREYETSDGTKGAKYELAFSSLEGYISGLEFFDGDYGKNLIVHFEFGKDAESLSLSLGAASSFGEDFMKKLPNIDYTKTVTLTPYSFEDENGKPRKGVTVTQDGEKIMGAFYDPEKKKSANGYPEPEGDTKDYDKDDWKIFFTKARKFLVSYTEKNVPTLIEKGFSQVELEAGDNPASDIAF